MKRGFFLPVVAFAGFLFLYIPIVSLVIFSFNKSKLVTVWGGWSTKWYVELLNDPQILGAAWISLKIGVVSATLATILGTIAAIVLTRFGRVRGRGLLIGMVTAPLVMPEVITGLSLLLLFISMEAMFGWPAGRGILTIIIAHTTFSMAYVAVVVQSRLVDMDDAIEEAASDLGAKPMRVFFDITLPMIAPSLISGWLLSFTLSLDDLVIASFVSGPGASTLPIVIFSKVRLGVTPEINALATLIVVVVAIGISIAWFLMRKKVKT